MPVFMILFYVFMACGLIMVVLSIIVLFALIVEIVKDKLEEWRRK